MKKIFCLAVLAALAAGLVFAGGSQSKSSAKGITFTVALEGDIEALDPGVAWDFTTNQVTNQITEGLVTFDENNNIIPLLAKSWRQTDETTYVYDVRDDIVFSDGTKMTMDDVLFSFERARNPDGGTWFSDFFGDVDNFSVNGWQFIIKLSTPSAVFKYIPATGAGRIISKAYYEKHADNFGTATGGIVGTGPFAFQSWTSGQQITLTKNTNYWDKAKLAANDVGTVVYRIISDDNARLVALQTGAVDFSVNLNEDMLPQLNTDKNLTVTTRDSQFLVYLALNTGRAPMNDVNVRRAVSRALNLPEFHRNIIKSAGAPGNVLPFGQALYGENASRWQQYLGTKNYSFDLAAAKQFLSRSAYPNGFTCSLVVGESPLRNQRALYIQEALKALSITVNIVKTTNEEESTYQTGGILDANGNRDYDMILGGWESDYPDPNANLEILYVSSQAGEDGYNSAAYQNPKVDELIASQLRIVDPTRRFEIQSQLADIIVDEVPYIIFDYSARISALNKKYTGVAATAAWLWSLPIHNVKAAK
ncbi:diguanylate phosphodiesterase [Spirochaetia bacterium]|nr:diguanylate phosphodiesterase [Spirochaetia bacterium]